MLPGLELQIPPFALCVESPCSSCVAWVFSRYPEFLPLSKDMLLGVLPQPWVQMDGCMFYTWLVLIKTNLFPCNFYIMFPLFYVPEFTPPVPFASRFLNTRTMKETFKSFVELLISVALDPDVLDALEKESGRCCSYGKWMHRNILLLRVCHDVVHWGIATSCIMKAHAALTTVVSPYST